MGARRQRLAFLAVGALAAAIGVAAYAVGLLHGLELESVDARYSVRGARAPSDRVVVVEVDDVTFDQLGLQWPFPRSVHARAIDRLREAGARAIAYDVQFTEPTTPRQDNALIGAVARAGDVVLATTEVDAHGRANVFGGEAVLRRIGAAAGNTVVKPDSDGTVRRFSRQIQGLRGFAVRTAEASGAAPPDEARPWIEYAGPPDTVPAVSFSRLVEGKVDPGFFRGKIVVVGASAPSLQDVHATPTGAGLMPGPEVQANAIATVLDGLPLRSAPLAVDLALIALLAAVGPLAGLALRPSLAFGAALAVAAAYLLALQVAFESGLILPVVYPLLALAVGTVGTLGLYYLLAAFERQRVRFTFSRFVPENVVEEVLAHGDGELRLGGVRREATLLFSDLRGFTTYSETRPPAEVVEVLNRYLGEMTDAIMDHGGTLVSYMGDGIMAVFGAPIEQPDHADRAIAAAREMLELRLPAFCEWMRGAGHGDGFEMGIGLNSGEVMSGQVGSARRTEYTTIGDTTNTAARLEGMSKATEHQVLISESTRAARTDASEELIAVGEMEVRGREEPIQVWSMNVA
jgi:adenylate cyclase